MDPPDKYPDFLFPKPKPPSLTKKEKAKIEKAKERKVKAAEGKKLKISKKPRIKKAKVKKIVKINCTDVKALPDSLLVQDFKGVKYICEEFPSYLKDGKTTIGEVGEFQVLQDN